MKQQGKFGIKDLHPLGKHVFLGENLVIVDTSVTDILHYKTQAELLEFENQWQCPRKINFILILCCLEGGLSLRFNLSKRKLSAGDLVVLPTETVVAYEDIAPDTRTISIGFSKQIGLPELLLKTNPELLVHTMRYPVMHLDEPELADLLTLYEILITRLSFDDFISKNDFFCSMIETMFHFLSKNLKTFQSTNCTKGQSQRIVEKFVNLLRQYGMRERDQNFYAEKLCISLKHLCRCVKDVTGKTPKQWIDDFLVLEAKAMLSDQAYSISEISRILGFATQSNFGRFFKNATGTSPTDYDKSEDDDKDFS